MRYWPFLIAASRRFDYRTVICPDFVDSGPRDLFQKHLDPRSYAAEGTTHTARAETREFGPVSIFYRTEFVRDAGKPDEFVYDGSGRRIYFTYGVVVAAGQKGESIDKVAVEGMIDSYRPDIVAHLQRLMASNEELPLAISRAEEVSSLARGAPPAARATRQAPIPPSPSRAPPSTDPARVATPVRSRHRILTGVWAVLLLGSVTANAHLLWSRLSLEQERARMQDAHDRELTNLKMEHARQMKDLVRDHVQAMDAREAQLGSQLRNEIRVYRQKDDEWTALTKQKQAEIDRLQRLIAAQKSVASSAVGEARETVEGSDRGSRPTKGSD
jgi:hypothetical protein